MVPLTCLAFLIGYFVIDSIPNFNAGLEKPTVYDYVYKLTYYISYNSFIQLGLLISGVGVFLFNFFDEKLQKTSIETM